MASTPYGYPAHPPTGGKGLPPMPTHSQSISTSHIHGNPPDLTKRLKLKQRYLKMQKKYFKQLEMQKDLHLELKEKEAKQQRLQDEVDLIIDQIYDSDYKHLRPRQDDLFSDDPRGPLYDGKDDDDNDEDDESEDEEGQGRIGKVKRMKREPGLEDQEEERRRQLEEAYGIDPAQTAATLNPHPHGQPIQQQDEDSDDSDEDDDDSEEEDDLPPQQPQPKRIKLTFGANGGGASIQPS